MRYHELIEAQPIKPTKPLSPDAGMKRAARVRKAQDALADTKAKASIDIAAKARKIADI